MQHSVRLIQPKDREGNDIIILTNCFDLSAKEIADLYRYRWKIETFFKWMKQHLNGHYAMREYRELKRDLRLK